MISLMPATHKVNGDEKVYLLTEINRMCQADGRWHRWQKILVLRDDKLTEFAKDMGLSKKWKTSQISILGLFEHTVDEMMEMANQMRELRWDKKDLCQLDKLKEGY